MITQSEAHKIRDAAIRTGWRRLKIGETVGYYTLPVFVGAVALWLLLVAIGAWMRYGHIQNMAIIFPVVVLVLAVVLFTGRTIMLRFEPAEAKLTGKEFHFIIKAIAKYYELGRIYIDEDIAVLYSGDFLSGRIVTVVRDKDRVLINSMVQPDFSDNTGMIGWESNTHNVARLKLELEEFARGVSPFGMLENPAPDDKPKKAR